MMRQYTITCSFYTSVRRHVIAIKCTSVTHFRPLDFRRVSQHCLAASRRVITVYYHVIIGTASVLTRGRSSSWTRAGSSWAAVNRHAGEIDSCRSRGSSLIRYKVPYDVATIPRLPAHQRPSVHLIALRRADKRGVNDPLSAL